MEYMKRLHHKTTLVTGCNRGIGRATVEKLAKEVANLIAFLASDEASYITGQVIRIDGGM